MEVLEERCKNLSTCPLKPQQRLELMRPHVLPRSYFELCLGQYNLHLLDTLDDVMRRHLRAWLHLLAYTSNGLFYSSMRDGELGISKLSGVITQTRIKNSLYILKSRDPMIWAVGQEMGLAKKLRRVSKMSQSPLPAKNLRKPSQYCSKWRGTDSSDLRQGSPH